jgi:hypothetical protein
MAVNDQPMNVRDIKKLLVIARKNPVSCALGRGGGKSGSGGLILLDKIKPPKSVMTDLKKQCPTLKTPCFGTAKVDPEENPKLVVFSLNKAVSGMSRAIIPLLRGTGFTKVSIQKVAPGPRQRL